MNTQHTEPAGQLPPDYIDTEHTGSSRELLRIFYTACLSEGGTADEVTLRGLRAAIAADRVQRQPAPPAPGEPTDEELYELWEVDGEGDFQDCRRFARDVLARWGRPAPQPADGEVAELVAWLRLTADEQPHTSGQGCIRLTRAADLLERLAPQPVPVAERLPGPGDCDAEGRCWWFYPEYPGEYSYWILAKEVCCDPTHCLPAHALPLPEEVEG